MYVFSESEELKKTKEKALVELNKKGVFEADVVRAGFSLWVKFLPSLDKKNYPRLAAKLKSITKMHSISPKFHDGFKVDNDMSSLSKLNEVSDELIRKELVD